MKRYTIADYLSDAEKQRILAHRFVMQGEETGQFDADGVPMVHRDLIPVSVEDGSCPLSYLAGIDNPAPDETAVALAVRSNGVVEYFEDNFDAIATAAAEFIEDWDAGRIPPAELAAALGVAVPS